MTKRFTGWHMAAILVAFFGTVVAVNLTMATIATRTFGGTVVDNSYVAGRSFNAWLKAARAQEKLGWTSRVALDERRLVAVAVLEQGSPPEGLVASGLARHPLGRESDIALRFRPTGVGNFRSDQPLPRGRWLLHLELRRGGDTVRLIESVS
ncbi:FixH family protein [Sphingosinicella rhizophila]|uniref:FixH family protein n=1 Tax=Sphingosinicella rhizophila TaxID=3050082 RepID=A0ABU3Q538_9SPHN|nr:FixH family protein [Sphingosinicella sp. GR2756]MDT9598511.1 FixH family protein [Sphingosinicella sp. GR2756]